MCGAINLEQHKRKSKSMTPTALSLFSGAGGLDIGFARAGFEVVGCVEIEADFCNTLAANEKKYFSKNCQIFNIDARLFEPYQLSVKRIDFIIGGPPVNPFPRLVEGQVGRKGLMMCEVPFLGSIAELLSIINR